MADQPELTHPVGKPNTQTGVEGLQGLQDSGLLWMLNQQLHSRGYEARVEGNQLVLAGRGMMLMAWPEDLLDKADERRRDAEQTLLDATQYNNPAYHDGHSPGFTARPAGG